MHSTQNLLHKEMSRKDFLKYSAFAFVSIIGVTALLRELGLRGATSLTSSFDPEAATISGNATILSDVTAAGGQAVQFKAPLQSAAGVTAIASSVLPAPTFPVRIDSDNRNFIDAAGARYYGVADTGWAAMNKLSKADFTAYATKRREQGYTMLLLSILRLENRSDAGNVRTDPQYATGKLPFSNMSDISTPLTAGTNTYWDHIEWCIDECKRLGLVAALVPSWYGYEGNAWRSTVAASTTKSASYGTFLASRFGSKTNVWWLMGGDTAPGSALAATNSMAAAIKAGITAGNYQLMTYHTGRNLSPWSNFGTQPWYNMHAAYSGVASGSDTNSGIRVTDEYLRTSVKPTMLVEDYYDKRAAFGASPDISRSEQRNQIWQSTLAGGFASAHGNEYTWRFVSGWNGASGLLAVSADTDNRIFSRVLNTWPDKRFLADHGNPIITTNRGSSTTTAYGIRSSDNTVGLVYIPANNRSIGINLSLFTGAKSLAWINPATGAMTQFATNITASTYTVTSPGTTGDAVLVIQTDTVPSTPDWLVKDDFSISQSPPTSTDTAQTWRVESGTWTKGSGVLYAAADGAIATVDLSSTTQTVEVVVSGTVAASSVPTIILGYNNTNDWHYRIEKINASEIRCIRRDPGATTIWRTSTGVFTGAGAKVRVSVTGTAGARAFRLWVNDSEITTLASGSFIDTDSTPPMGEEAGLRFGYTSTGNAYRYQSFRANNTVLSP